MSLFGVLAVVFIVLKIIGVITWSWWWVLSPIWLPILAYILISLIILVVGSIADFIFRK